MFEKHDDNKKTTRTSNYVYSQRYGSGFRKKRLINFPVKNRPELKLINILNNDSINEKDDTMLSEIN